MDNQQKNEIKICEILQIYGRERNGWSISVPIFSEFYGKIANKQLKW